MGSQRRAAAHLRLEAPNRKFGRRGLRCGEQGFLSTETLQSWFQRFGRPISADSDVKKYGAALLQRHAPDLRTDRKREHLASSLHVRRVQKLEDHLAELLPGSAG